MFIEKFLVDYGYLILFLGAILEGETFLIIAGFLVHQGYFVLPTVIFVAALGALLGDQFYFFLGRTGGRRFLNKYETIKNHAEKIHNFLKKYEEFSFIGFRFAYGMRTITPMIIGSGKTDWKKFFIYNIIGSILWAFAFVLFGYFLGEAARTIFGKIKHIEFMIILWIGIGGMIFAIAATIYNNWKKTR